MKIRDVVDAPVKYRAGRSMRHFQVDADSVVPPTDDFSEVGTPGIRQFAGIISEAYTSELNWPSAGNIYDDMRRRTPTIRALLNAITLLAKQTTWYFEPASGSEIDQQAAQFANECLDDLQQPFSQTVEDMLTAIPFGWAMSEVVFGRRIAKIAPIDSWSSRYDDGLIGWRSFEFRKQRSWWKWEFDETTRKYKGMWQMDAPHPPVFIPLGKSIHFTPFRDGANPEGMSLLETAYEPYYYLKNYGIILGVGMERSVTGWPVFKYASKPSDADRQRVEAATRTLLAGNESAWLSLPPGVEFEFKNVTNTNANATLEIMRYYNVLILQMLLADFIWMGAGASGGSYGLGQDKSVLFIMAVNGVLDSLAAAVNNSAVRKLFEYNTFPGLVAYPRLVHSPVRKPISLGELGSFIGSISTVIPLSLDDQASIRDYSNGVLSPQVVEPPKPTVDPMTGLPLPTTPNPILTPGEVGSPVPTNDTGAVGGEPQANFSKPVQLNYITRNSVALLADYEADLSAALDDYILFGAPVEEAKKKFNNAMLAYLPEAFYKGYVDGGGDLSQLPDSVQILLGEYIAREYSFSDRFWNKLQNAKEHPPEGGLVPPSTDLWVNTMTGMYSLGKAASAPDELLTFVRVAATKDRCKTCVGLEGKRHSAKWFADRGYIPMPGCNLDCGGYHCGHELQNDAGEAWLAQFTGPREVAEVELTAYFGHAHPIDS